MSSAYTEVYRAIIARNIDSGLQIREQWFGPDDSLVREFGRATILRDKNTGFAYEGRPVLSYDQQDGIDHSICVLRDMGTFTQEEWRNSAGQLHRSNDQPAIIVYSSAGILEKRFYDYGLLHRERKPARLLFDPKTSICVLEEHYSHGIITNQVRREARPDRTANLKFEKDELASPEIFLLAHDHTAAQRLQEARTKPLDLRTISNEEFSVYLTKDAQTDIVIKEEWHDESGVLVFDFGPTLTRLDNRTGQPMEYRQINDGLVDLSKKTYEIELSEEPASVISIQWTNADGEQNRGRDKPAYEMYGVDGFLADRQFFRHGESLRASGKPARQTFYQGTIVGEYDSFGASIPTPDGPG
nr:hypothetical protein [Nitrosomonas nitrosa]